MAASFAEWMRNQSEERVGRHLVRYGEYAAIAYLAAQQHEALVKITTAPSPEAVVAACSEVESVIQAADQFREKYDAS